MPGYPLVIPHDASVRSRAPPAANDPLTQKSCHAALPALPSTTPAICSPAPAPPPLAAPRILVPRTPHRPAPATHADQACRSVSAAYPLTAHRPPGPCTAANVATTRSATPRLATAPHPSHTPLTASRLAHPRAPALPPPSPPHSAATAPQSPLTQSENHESLPDDHCDLNTQCSHPPNTSQHPPSGTSVHPAAH